MVSGLTQVLADGTNGYLYGAGRIGEEQPGGWQYHLPDALGSVRQLGDASAAVTLAQAYEPFGSVLASDGVGSTAFQFTSEQVDGTGLVYLRARYYTPGQGRFVSRDTWGGAAAIPLSINRWAFAHSNPVNYSDPSGHSISPTGPQMCLSFFVYGLLPAPTMSSDELVNFCKSFYSQSFWKDTSVAGLGNYDCASMNVQPWEKPRSISELFGYFICELGRSHIRFNGNDALTRELAHSYALDRVRRDFYNNGPIHPREERFGLREYLEEWINREESGFPIMQVIGSFDVSVQWTSRGRVKMWVHNRMDLASGTHFVGRFPPEGQSRFPLSLEEVLGNEPSLRIQPAWWVVATYEDNHRGRIVSVLRPRGRDLTGPGMGGGNFEQTFIWTERNLRCDIEDKPWPSYLQLLDIGLDH